MKFLVLALCVCAASAAPANGPTFTFDRQAGLKPWQQVNKPFGRSFETPTPVQFTRTVSQVAPTFGKTVETVVPVFRSVEQVPVKVFETVTVVPAVTAFKKFEGVAPVVKGTYGSEFDAPILRSESDVKPDGFNYVYETGNGIAAEATGDLKTVDGTNVVITRGAYRYTSPDGTPVVVNYVADENGYQPQSDLLPVGPPIPAAIARSLQWIAEHPAPVEVISGRKF